MSSRILLRQTAMQVIDSGEGCFCNFILHLSWIYDCLGPSGRRWRSSERSKLLLAVTTLTDPTMTRMKLPVWTLSIPHSFYVWVQRKVSSGLRYKNRKLQETTIIILFIKEAVAADTPRCDSKRLDFEKDDDRSRVKVPYWLSYKLYYHCWRRQ